MQARSWLGGDPVRPLRLPARRLEPGGPAPPPGPARRPVRAHAACRRDGAATREPVDASSRRRGGCGTKRELRRGSGPPSSKSPVRHSPSRVGSLGEEGLRRVQRPAPSTGWPRTGRDDRGRRRRAADRIRPNVRIERQGVGSAHARLGGALHLRRQPALGTPGRLARADDCRPGRSGRRGRSAERPPLV